MKLLIFCLVLSFSFNIYADNITTNQPAPMNCYDSEDHPAVNWIEDLSAREDHNIIRLNILTSIGECKDHNRIPHKLHVPFISIWEEIINYPQTEFGHELQIATPTQAILTFTFDKNIIFAKKDSRQFTYTLNSLGLFEKQYIQFEWVITLNQIKDENGSPGISVDVSHKSEIL